MNGKSKSLDKFTKITYHFSSRYLDVKVRKSSVSFNKKLINIDNFYSTIIKLIQANILRKYALGYYRATSFIKNKYNIDMEIIESDSQVFVWFYTYVKKDIDFENNIKIVGNQ
jgi:hypothetical protein